MSARDKARAAALRRASDATFAQEAARRGYRKLDRATIPCPRGILVGYIDELKKQAMHMLEEPAYAFNDLSKPRTMYTAAKWLEGFIEIHESELKTLGLEVSE